MEEERQKELFTFDTPKRRFSGFAGIFRKAGIDGSVFAITLKIDKLVFISIAIIMIMVIVYALGVESGRSVKPKPSIAPAAVNVMPVKSISEIKPLLEAKTVTVVKEAVKPYTIAVASLSKKETALEEAARMRSKGLNSFIIQSPPYYVVCVGEFSDKTSSASQTELARVKRFCRDAYFKQR